MRWLLFLLSGLALIDGVVTYMDATTIFQQIAGLLALLAFAVLFSAAGIVDAIVTFKLEVRKIKSEQKKVEQKE